jgi:uncharacterized membrane protein YdbT with pleckstrin-like domain
VQPRRRDPFRFILGAIRLIESIIVLIFGHEVFLKLMVRHGDDVLPLCAFVFCLAVLLYVIWKGRTEFWEEQR